MENATFYYFKPYGKYYAEDRGVVTPEVYRDIRNSWRERITLVNKGRWPGLGKDSSWARVVIIPDKDLTYAWPLCLEPENPEF